MFLCKLLENISVFGCIFNRNFGRNQNLELNQNRYRNSYRNQNFGQNRNRNRKFPITSPLLDSNWEKIMLQIFAKIQQIYNFFTFVVEISYWWSFWGLRVRRSNFMRSKFISSWDQNSFLHEIKFMRSNFLSFFMRSKFLIINSISWSQYFSWDQNCLIMLFGVLISWSCLWLKNWSWDQNSKKHY